MKDDTKLIHAGRARELLHGCVNPPVFHASTILFDSLADHDRLTSERGPRTMTYGRRGTPTLWSLQEGFSELHGAQGAVACPSGVAAIAVAFLTCLDAGDHVLIADTVYGPTRALADHHLKRLGIAVDYYDPTDVRALETAIGARTRAIFVESPGSLTFEVQDLKAVCALAKRHGLKTIMDNTWATPVFLQPLKFGIDLVMESATKYIVGHSDASVGLIAANAETYADLIRTHGDLGQTCGPDDAYIAARGLRTLKLRLLRHQEAGLALARWLQSRPQVRRVLHPALESDPGHELWRRDFTGASGLFSFVMDPVPRPRLAEMIDGLEHFGIGYSWGGFESLILPARPHRTASPWRDEGQLIRIHAGLEDTQDLIADLEAGFERLGQA